MINESCFLHCHNASVWNDSSSHSIANRCHSQRAYPSLQTHRVSRVAPVVCINNLPHLNDDYSPINISGFSSTAVPNTCEHDESSIDSSSPDVPAFDGNGLDSGDITTGGGGGNGGSGSGGSGGESDDALPEDVRAALAYGHIKQSDIVRYVNALSNPFIRMLMAIPAFRSRFLMDPSFLFKLAVQELVGNGTALAGEIAVRGREIVHEVEYVTSDLIVGTVVEAAFVWLLAPTLPPLNLGGNTSPLARYIAALPSHVFQPSTAMQSFTTAQRAVSFFYAAGQYAVMGFVGGVVGTAITYGLLETRKKLQKGYKPMRPMPPVLPNAAGWAAFLGVSANTRFQATEGLELVTAKLMAGSSTTMVNSAIVALRFLNNYWGGVQFVQFFRAIGLQPTGDEHASLPDGDRSLSPQA